LANIGFVLVDVMKPIFKPDNIVSFVLYPYRIYHIRLYFKRLIGSPRILDFYAYVDCIRLGVERGDGLIGIESWNVNDNRVMSEIVDEKIARAKAVESAVNWGNMRVVSWWTPRVEVLKSLKAYKVFWVFERDGEDFIMDSLNGEVVELKRFKT